MSTLAPVSATISRITLPPVPMMSRIFDLSICIVSIRGAWADSSVRAEPSAFAFRRGCARGRPSAWFERLLHDLLGDAGDLDVHLHRGDAFGGAGDLEVHVAEVILVAEDVAEDGEVLAFEDQAHRDARDRADQRNARVHHRQASRRRRSPSTLEPLDSVMSDTTRIV